MLKMLNLVSSRFDVMSLVASGIVLLLCIPVHEFAHAYAASKLGDNTAKAQGRLTLNPLAHLSLIGSISLVLLGIGWANPVPVDTRNFKKPKRDMGIVAAAGPLSNFIMAFLVMFLGLGSYRIALMQSTQQAANFFAKLSVLLYYIVFINIQLGVFNLIPVLPFDGGNIVSALLPEKWERNIRSFFSRYQGAVAVVLLVLLFTGVLTKPLQYASQAIFGLFETIILPIFFH